MTLRTRSMRVDEGRGTCLWRLAYRRLFQQTCARRTSGVGRREVAALGLALALSPPFLSPFLPTSLFLWRC